MRLRFNRVRLSDGKCGHGGVWWPHYPINAENGRKGTCFATSELGNTVAVVLGQERLS